MEIEIRFQIDDGFLARVDINYKNFKNGVSFCVVIEHPLLVILRHIGNLRKQETDPKEIQQLNQFLEKLKTHLRTLYKQRQNNEIQSVTSSINTNEVKQKQKSDNSLRLLEDVQSTKLQLENSSSVSTSTFISLFKNAYNKEFSQLVSSVQEGFEAGNEPDLCEEGVNGTYFLNDKNGNKIAVFKPQDEEGNSNSNPKNNSSQDDESKGLLIQGKGGIKEGEASQREVAAYLLDKQNFFGVPVTQMISISHPYFNSNNKIGSLQAFVISDGCSEDIAINCFPSKEVHKIGVLDLQLFNMDRHGGNILYRRTPEGHYTLIPIDHGFSLPDQTGLGNAWFDWLTWPQAKQEFDEETKKYVENIDLEEDLVTLERELGIRKECLKTMRISTTLLKKAVSHNLTLYDIGSIVCRKTLEEPSQLEMMCKKAQEEVSTLNSNTLTCEEMYFKCLFRIMDEELGK